MEKKIKRILIIGAGNVATHLATSFSRHVEIVGIFSKNHLSSKVLASHLKCPHIESIAHFPPCDLILVCVQDSSINDLILSIPNHFNIAYSSGSVDLPLDSQRENYGVFYPLQTFSKERELDISNVPFFIEATNKTFAKQLFDFALLLSSHVTYATSLERKNLHISAIFVSNFINHLAYLSQEHAESNHLNWDHLKPLINETIYKIVNSSPKASQTGPARRNDLEVINDHLQMLNGFPKDIYKVISESILYTYSKSTKND